MMRIRSLMAVGALSVGAFGAATAAAAVGCSVDTFEVSGTVTDAVTGVPLGDSVTSVSFQSDSYGDDQGTALDGTYSLCLPPGMYTVSFAADGYVIGWYDGVFEASAATQVTVATTNVGGIDAALYPLPTISGRVTDRRTGAGVFSGVGITDAATGVGLDGDGTDADGYFTYTVPREYLPGRFKINFVADSYWADWYDNARRIRHATVISVAPDSGDITGVDAELKRCVEEEAQPACLPKKFGD